MPADIKTITTTIADPTADDRFLIFKVPAGAGQCQVLEAYAHTDVTLAEGDTDFVKLTLQDGGADGTGTATVGAEISNLATGSKGAWTTATPKPFTISEVLLDEGDYLVLKYDEGGTVAGLNWVVSVSYIQGKR